MKTLYVDYIMRILHLDILKTNTKKIKKIEGVRRSSIRPCRVKPPIVLIERLKNQTCPSWLLECFIKTVQKLEYLFECGLYEPNNSVLKGLLNKSSAQYDILNM